MADIDEAYVTHGSAWIFLDGRKYRNTSISEFVDRIEFIGVDQDLQVGTIIRKPGTSAWLVEFADGRRCKIQHVAGCGCSGAPNVQWEEG